MALTKDSGVTACVDFDRNRTIQACFTPYNTGYTCNAASPEPLANGTLQQAVQTCCNGTIEYLDNAGNTVALGGATQASCSIQNASSHSVVDAFFACIKDAGSSQLGSFCYGDGRPASPGTPRTRRPPMGSILAIASILLALPVAVVAISV